MIKLCWDFKKSGSITFGLIEKNKISVTISKENSQAIWPKMFIQGAKVNTKDLTITLPEGFNPETHPPGPNTPEPKITFTVPTKFTDNSFDIGIIYAQAGFADQTTTVTIGEAPPGYPE